MMITRNNKCSCATWTPLLSSCHLHLWLSLSLCFHLCSVGLLQGLVRSQCCLQLLVLTPHVHYFTTVYILRLHYRKL